jgi:hypothetical protein
MMSKWLSFLNFITQKKDWKPTNFKWINFPFHFLNVLILVVEWMLLSHWTKTGANDEKFQIHSHRFPNLIFNQNEQFYNFNTEKISFFSNVKIGNWKNFSIKYMRKMSKILNNFFFSFVIHSLSLPCSCCEIFVMLCQPFKKTVKSSNDWISSLLFEIVYKNFQTSSCDPWGRFLFCWNLNNIAIFDLCKFIS